MSVIVTDRGFGQDDFAGRFFTPETAPANDCRTIGLDLGPDTDPATLEGAVLKAALIRIAFPSFNDGRGFSLARLLRARGFTGRLRAKGHVLADQFAMARRSGFDEVEIDEALAARQPEDQWQARADWHAHDYRRRLAARG